MEGESLGVLEVCMVRTSTTMRGTRGSYDVTIVCYPVLLRRRFRLDPRGTESSQGGLMDPGIIVYPFSSRL